MKRKLNNNYEKETQRTHSNSDKRAQKL